MSNNKDSTKINTTKYLIREAVFKKDISSVYISKKLNIPASYIASLMVVDTPHFKKIIPKLSALEKLLKLPNNYFNTTTSLILKESYDFNIERAVKSLYQIKYRTISKNDNIELSRQAVIRSLYTKLLNSGGVDNEKIKVSNLKTITALKLFVGGRVVNNKAFIAFNQTLNLPLDWHIQELIKANVEGTITEEDRFYIKYLNAEILEDITNILKFKKQEMKTPIESEMPLETFELKQYSVWASAGIGIANENIEYDILTLPINDFLSKYDVTKTQLKSLHALIVSGDSMVPIINDEQRIYVDTSIKQVYSDGIYLIRKDDELFVKSAVIHDNGSVEFYSRNPEYRKEDVRLNDQSVHPIEVLGKVISRK